MPSAAHCAPAHSPSPVSRLPSETLASILYLLARPELIRVSTVSRAWRRSARFDQRFFLCAKISIRPPKEWRHCERREVQLARGFNMMRYAWTHGFGVQLSLKVSKAVYRSTHGTTPLEDLDFAISSFISLWSAGRTFISSLRMVVDAGRLAELERELRGQAPRLYTLSMTNLSNFTLPLVGELLSDGAPRLQVINLDHVLPSEQVPVTEFRRVTSAKFRIADRHSIENMRISTMLPSIQKLELDIYTALKSTKTFSDILEGTQLNRLDIYGAPRIAFGPTTCLKVKHVQYSIDEPLDLYRFLMREETSGNIWTLFPTCGVLGTAVGLDILRGPRHNQTTENVYLEEMADTLMFMVNEPLTGMTRGLNIHYPSWGVRPSSALPIVIMGIQTIRMRLTSITVCPETVFSLLEAGEMPALGRLVVQLRHDWLDTRGSLVHRPTDGTRRIINAPALRSVTLTSWKTGEGHRISMDMFKELGQMIGLGGVGVPHLTLQLHDVRVFKM